MLDGVSRIGVKVKARHHELPLEGWDMISSEREELPQAPHLYLMERLPAHSLNAFLNQLGDVLDAKNL